MKSPSSHPESLRRQQPAPVRPSNRLLVAADEFRNFECGQQPIRQCANRRGRCVRRLAVVPSMLLIRVRVLPHGVLRDVVGSHIDATPGLNVKSDEPVRMPPRVNGPGGAHSSVAGSEDRNLCGPMGSRMVRLERERNRPGALVALSAHQEHRRTGDVSACVDVLRGAAARSRMSRRSLQGPSVLICRPLGGADRCG